MSIVNKVIPILVVVSFSWCSFGQELDQRFAEFQFERADVSRRFSVLIEKNTVRENVEDNCDSEVGSVRILQRLMFGNDGRWQRIDGINISFVEAPGLSQKAHLYPHFRARKPGFLAFRARAQSEERCSCS